MPIEPTKQIDDFNKIIKLVENRCSFSLGSYKHKYLRESISRRMGVKGIDNIENYIQFSKDNSVELDRLANNITNNTSRFFRDNIVFECIQHFLLPEIIKRKNEIRIWSAGCACGEEAYSLAIIIAEISRLIGIRTKTFIFASDINKVRPNKAIDGIFDVSSIIEVKMEIIDRYFVRKGNKFQINKDKLPRIVYCIHDLISPNNPFPVESVYGDYDIVLCRNVLMYLNDESRRVLLSNLYSSMSNNGNLIIGKKESVNDDRFNNIEIMDNSLGMYNKRSIQYG